MSSVRLHGVLSVLVCLGLLFITGTYQHHLPESYRIFIPPAKLLPPGWNRILAYFDTSESASESGGESKDEPDQATANSGKKPIGGGPNPQAQSPGAADDQKSARVTPHNGMRPGAAAPANSAGPATPATPATPVRAEVEAVKRRILEAGRGDRYLRPFFKRLARLEDGDKTVVRVIHYGDSVNWGDNVTIKIKQLMQRQFGDGGRGLVNVVDRPAMRLLEHTNLTRGGFHAELLPFVWFHFKPLPRLGFTAFTFRPALRGVGTQHMAPAASEPWRRVRLILRDPRNVDPARPAEPEPYMVEVQALGKQENGKPGWTSQEATLRLAPGECDVLEAEIPSSRRVQVKFSRPGAPYIDGMALETERGVSYSSVVRMGVHMAWMSAIPYANRECGYRAYKPDLIIMQFGTNESASIDGFAHFNATKYRNQVKKHFEEIRRMQPDVPLLVFGPYERLVPTRRGLVASHSQLVVRRIQQEVAAELELPYFDSYLAFGGPGHMARLVARGFAHTDYMHITGRGGFLLGQHFYDELMQAYGRFRGRADVHGAGGSGGTIDLDSAGQGNKPAKTIAADAHQDAGAIQFNSKAFAYFLGLVLIFGNFFVRWPWLRLVFLVLASYYFYATWMVWPLLLILISTVVDYGAGLGIARAREAGGRGTVFLLLSLAVNLGLLFFFKYFDFLAEAVNDLLAAMTGAGAVIPSLELLLPVGISFYTFQTLSYTIDVWRGELKVERNPLRFAFYVAFFSQLVAGPIVRAREFLPGLGQKIRHFPVDLAALGTGTFLIFAGLLKKSGADWLAVNVVDRVYLDPSRFTSMEALAAIYGYGLQIYGDFSGYTDIALGSAMLLGLNLTENFRRPYQSASISEFWRRWHISLGSWFRDYLYIALGGNRRRVYANLLITMFLVGLWHGAGWNFILWGLFNAAFLMGERLFRLDRRETDGEKTGMSFWRPLRVLVTLHVVLFGWIIFRVQDLATAQSLWDNLARLDFRLKNLGAVVFAVIAIAYLYHFSPIAWRERAGGLWNRLWSPVRGALAAVVIVFVYNIQAPSLQPYIYFQF